MGEILETLRGNGLAENTLVIFTSDNGPTASGSAGPMRGFKFTTYEGGMRVPAVFWCPETVKAGQVSDEIVSALDLFPTIAHYAGAKLPGDRTYDGYNVASLIEGDTEESPRNEVFYYGANTKEINGVRIGDWKYLAWGEHPRKRNKDVVPALYNLRQDIGETRNLIGQHAETAERLIARMRAFDAAAEQQ